jgi:hypothetical protein
MDDTDRLLLRGSREAIDKSRALLAETVNFSRGEPGARAGKAQVRRRARPS